MKSLEIRETFKNFFAQQGHEWVESSSLVPQKDPTVLFTNAGMHQFKDVFLGFETRPYKTAASIQKCVRAGGKHNDLENVGYTRRHHTFFEMMGNFSFGDYFREKAISYSWDLLVHHYGLDPKKLSVSVFKDDDESFQYWHHKIGLPKERIHRLSGKDNFWRMGDVGPCGPCTEIYYDMGEGMGGSHEINVVGGEGDRFIEVWNLVLMAYEDEPGGTQKILPHPSIDTGCGLERLATILQNQKSNYHTDLFRPLIEEVSIISQTDYTFSDTPTDVAMRVLADHSRAISFLILDGVMPSHEGRGYVLRRIIRRALRYAKKLKVETVLEPLVRAVIKNFLDLYPEFQERKNLILSTVKIEEEKFLRTLEQGLHLFEKEMSKGLKKKTLSGEFAFKMYDTYGFPFDLTCLVAKEKGYSVDKEGFEKFLKEAQRRSRKTSFQGGYEKDEGKLRSWAEGFPSTLFLGRAGYNSSGQVLKEDKDFCLKTKAQLLGLFKNQESVPQATVQDDHVWAVFDKTCFYAEAGGQIGDQGLIQSGTLEAKVLDCQASKGVFLHQLKILKGTLETEKTCSLEVDVNRRKQVAQHHSATHLLHKALKMTLGDSVEQKGSLVTEDRLRFDFTHPKPLTSEEKEAVEKYVTEEIQKEQPVKTDIMTQKEALEKGAVALFGEKYGDCVRVLTMGPSMELCGGTHVANTSEIEHFLMGKESAVSSGVRRLEAFAGNDNCDKKFQEKKKMLKKELPQKVLERFEDKKNFSDPSFKSYMSILKYVEALKEELKKEQKTKEKEILKSMDLKAFLKEAEIFTLNSQKHSFLFKQLKNLNQAKAAKKIAKSLNQRNVDFVVLVGELASQGGFILLSLNPKLTQKMKANDILKNVIFKNFSGKGGGRPDLSQGSFQENVDVEKLFSVLKDYVHAL